MIVSKRKIASRLPRHRQSSNLHLKTGYRGRLRGLALLMIGSLFILVADAVFAQAGAQGNNQSAKAPFDEVTAEFEKRTFNKALPFDTPFLLTGSALDGATRVVVTYLESDGTLEKLERKVAKEERKIRRRRSKVNQLKSTNRDPHTVDRLEKKIAADQRKVRVLKKEIAALRTFFDNQPGTVLHPWEQLPGSTSTKFSVRVPALDPEQYYTFEFQFEREVNTNESNTFKASARPLVSDLLWDDIPDGDFSVQESRQLREDLIEILKDAIMDRLFIAPGTIFDPDLPDNAIENKFDVLVVSVADQQSRITSAITTIHGQKPTFENRLDAIRKENTLMKLKNALVELAPEDSNIKDLLDTYKDALALRELDSHSRSRVAAGQDPSVVTPPLLTSRNPANIDEYIKQYMTTVKLLKELRELVQKLVNDNGPYREYTQKALDAGKLDITHIPILRNQVDTLLNNAHGDASSLLSNVNRIKRALTGRKNELDALIAEVDLRAKSGWVVLSGSTIDNVTTPQANYISADAGLMYAGQIGAVMYIGTNIYLRPINKKIPLRQRGTFKHRFAFTIGLTVQSIEDSTPQTRKNLFGNQALLVGGGFRFNESVRVGFGGLIFLKQNTNPLVDDFDPGVVPYISLSFDWNVAKTFAGLGSLFGG